MEVVGYIFRLLSSQQDPYSIPWYMVQYFFIIVAPVLYSAGIYTVVSVLISTCGLEFSLLPLKAVLWLFVSCDVVATVMQIIGAALVGARYSNQGDPRSANNILLAGLAFQVFLFAVFLVILSLVLYKARRSQFTVSHSFIAAVVIATLAVYLRTCFRLAETADGLQQNLSTHEGFFGCMRRSSWRCSYSLTGILVDG